MSENIVAISETNVPGVELIYLEDLDVAGIHYSGLARLLGCNPETVQNAAEAVKFEHVFEAEIHTAQGLRTVKFILEQGVIEVLEKIQDSTRIKKETRNAARQIYRQFAKAGFKLYAMLQVAPHKLKQQVDAHVEYIDKQIKLQRLCTEERRLEAYLSDRQDNRIALHGLEVALLLEGKADAIVEIEKPTLEVINQKHNVRFSGQTLAQVKEYLEKRTGKRFKSGADLKRLLEKRKLGHLIAQTPRSILADYVPTENLEAVYQALSASDRQMLLGEN
jgi:hypothetical protein